MVSLGSTETHGLRQPKGTVLGSLNEGILKLAIWRLHGGDLEGGEPLLVIF